MGKYPVKGFPYTEEDVHGNEVPTTEAGLRFMVYIMLQIDHIFEQNRNIKIRGRK